MPAHSLEPLFKLESFAYFLLQPDFSVRTRCRWTSAAMWRTSRIMQMQAPHTPTKCMRVLLEHKGLLPGVWCYVWKKTSTLFLLWSNHVEDHHPLFELLKIKTHDDHNLGCHQSVMFSSDFLFMFKWSSTIFLFFFTYVDEMLEMSEEEIFFLSGMLWFGSPQ